MQSMVGKAAPKLPAASSPWSPAIAKQQAKQAEQAARQATNAAARVTKQAATQSHRQMVQANAAKVAAAKTAAAQLQKTAIASAAAQARTTKAAAAQSLRQINAANRAEVAAAKQKAREVKAAASQAHKQMIAAQKAQDAILKQAWNRQDALHKAHLRDMAADKKAADAKAEIQQKAHSKRMAGLQSLTPLGFADKLNKSKLVNAGKQLTWIGRQLTYNFTLPLALAGGAAMKFAMDNERAMTQVRKVYGDIGEDPAMLKKELDALATTFELLSGIFGVHQEEVIGIAAAWAAAGSAGVGLANNVRATLETMILGDMDAQAATEGLIAIQAQWRFSTQKNAEGVSELTTQLAYLNAIENATGISTEGLIEVIQRAGGNARTSGASLRELGALAAALVPATGDAAQAGTALRSMISSLMSPTAQATEALDLMGITVTDPSWMGAPITRKLEMLAENFTGLSDAQQGVVSQFIATKWQVSRFDVLMRDIASGTGYYAKALDVTSDASKALEIRNRELLAVLTSHPKQWEIMTNVMRNAMAKVIVPLIPAILSVVKFITELAVAFSELSPETQKWILIGLTMVALLGPLIILLGSTMTLVGTLGSAFGWLGEGIFKLVKKGLIPLMEHGFIPLLKLLRFVTIALMRTAVTAVASFLVAIGPIGWIIIGVVAAITAAVLLILHTDLEVKVWEIMKSVGNAFASLGKWVYDALMNVIDNVVGFIDGLSQVDEAVWRIIQNVANAFAALPRAVFDALSAVIRVLGQFIEGVVEALSYLNPFARHSPSLVDNVREGVSTILDEYARLQRIPEMIAGATAALEELSRATTAGSGGKSRREIELQKQADIGSMGMPSAQPAANAVVQEILALEAQLPAIAAEIRNQERVVEQWTAALEAADAQIEAMEAGLEALEKQYDAVGNAIAAAESRISDLADTPIQGLSALEDQIFANQHAQNLLNMELLEFERRGLTLDSIRDKYAAMAGELELLRGTQAELRGAGAGSDILGWYDQQISAIEAQRSEMGEVEKTITDIEQRLDALDLEGRFLALTKAINFDPLERQIDRIVNGIVEMPFDEIVRQILEQQALVQQLKPQYDALGAAVEQERAAIEAAKDAREGIQDQLDAEEQKVQDLKAAYSDIESLIGDMEAALNSFAQAAEEAKKDTDEMSRIEELFTAGEGLDFEDMGGNAPLGREGGLAEIEAMNEELQRELEEALAGIGDMDLFGTLQDKFDELKDLDFGNMFGDMFAPIKEKVREVWDWIKSHIWDALNVILGFAVGWLPALYMLLFRKFAAPVAGWVNDNIIQPLWQAIQKGWDAYVMPVWNWLWANLIRPIIDFAIRMWPVVQEIWDVIIGIIRTAWEVIVGVFNWAWGVIQAAWQIIVDVFNWAWGFIEPVLNTLWQVVQTVWDGIVAAFQWAWGFIEPIFTWIWDKIDGYIIPIFELFWVMAQIAFKLVVEGLQWLWGHADEIFNFIVNIIDNVVVPVFEWLWERAKEVFGFLGDAIEWVWKNIIEPVFNLVKWVIENIVIPAFTWLWERGKEVFAFLGTAIDWTWNNIIKPIFDGVKWVIENVVIPAFTWLWNEGERLFNLLGSGLSWVWDNVISPIWDKFKWAFEHVIGPAFNFLKDKIIKPVMEAIYNGIATVWNAIAGLIEGGVNFFIGAFNKIADAVNAIAGFLGIDDVVSTMKEIHIGRMEGGFSWNEGGGGGGGGIGTGGVGAPIAVAKGGVVGPNGGTYNIPTAIVGEGSRIHPEYVIPTDPRYRERAFQLMQSLGTQLLARGGTVDGEVMTQGPPSAGGATTGSAANFVPVRHTFDDRNFLQRAMDGIASVGGTIANGAIRGIWAGPAALVRGAINLIPNKIFQQAAEGIFGIVDRWVTKLGTDWDAEAELRVAPEATQGAGSWRAIVEYLKNLGVPHRVLSTHRPGAVTRTTGNPSWHGMDRAIDLSGPEGMVNFSQSTERIAAAIYTGFKGQLHELIWGGTQAYNVWEGQSHSYSPALMREHYNHVHASLAEGGRFHVPNIPGGVNMNIAEGRSGEEVQILPIDETQAGGGTTIIINGNLEFPNVTNGSDAKNFIGNLKALA
jgi:TP901 family phage tail tape measure protein